MRRGSASAPRLRSGRTDLGEGGTKLVRAERSRGVRHRAREAGFTLAELLVSLFIFGLLSAGGVAVLSASISGQEVVAGSLEKVAAVRRFSAIAAADFAQAAPRMWRDEAGAPHAAFLGDDGRSRGASLFLVRHGWTNHGGAPRASLQKVYYGFNAGRLERLAFPFVDGAAPMEPVAVLDGLRSVRFRYRDKNGAWLDLWNPRNVEELPRAVEMIVEPQEGPPVRQLFLVGAAL